MSRGDSDSEEIALPELSQRDKAAEAAHHESSPGDTTSTNSEDEFDWEADEDVVSVNERAKAGKARRGRFIWNAFMKLARPVRTLVVAILGAGIFIIPLLVFESHFQENPARPHAHAWSLWLAVVWGTSCITLLIVDLVPRTFIGISVLLGYRVERLKIQIELIFAISGWLKLALIISWAWIALSIIRAAYNPPGTYWVIVNRVMQALFSAGLIILAEKTFLHLVAINFHQKALADRLAENRLGLKALDLLSNAHPRPKKSPYGHTKKGHRSSGFGFGTSIEFFGIRENKPQDRSMVQAASSSSSPIQDKEREYEREKDEAGYKVGHKERKRRRKKAMAAVIVDQLGGAIGQIALKNSKFNREQGLGDLQSARRLARKLFSTLSDVYPPRSHLIVEDFYPYFKSTAEAHAAFALFDQDSNGDITKKEMREAVQRIYRERKALISSLKDVSSVVAKLDAVLLCAALVAIIFLCLLIFNRGNALASLVPLATIILGFSFIFGHSAQTLFESLIFIFATHVFDVGDLVMIDDQPLFVKEFGLFSTTFRRVDGQEIIAPNALLSGSKLVHNMRRSSSMWESTILTVSYTTPLEVIEQLKTRLNTYIARNSREWSGLAVNIDKMEFQNSIDIAVAVEHRPNWQDWGGRWMRRTEFMRHLKTVLEELDIRYTKPVQPVLLPKGVPTHVPSQSGLFSDSASSLRRAPSYRAGASSREDLGNAESFPTSEFLLRTSVGLNPGGSSF